MLINQNRIDPAESWQTLPQLEIKTWSKLSDNPVNNFQEKYKIKIAEIP